jgi:hypothetical protein
MKHRGQTRTVSFRLSGAPLKELERQAEEFGISLGDLSRAVIDRHLRNAEFSAILTLIQAMGDHQQQQGEALTGRLAELAAEVAALRRDFNLAVGRTAQP